MAIPLIDFLEGSARAAYGFLEQAASSPLSANKILSQLSAAGLGINRQVGLDIIATLRGSASSARTARLLPPNMVIPSDIIAPSPHPLTKQYSFRVKYFNTELGAPGFVNVSSNLPLSVNDIFAQATTTLLSGDYPAFQGFDPSTTDLTLDRALAQSELFSQAEQQQFIDASQSLLEGSGGVSPGSGGPLGPEGFGHGF